METKPLHVLAAEACGFTCVQGVGLGNYPYWAIECGPNAPPRSLPHYHTDYGAAMELLKAAKRSGLCDEWSVGVLPHDVSWCRLYKSSREISFADDDDSLARAIYLALVAAKGET